LAGAAAAGAASLALLAGPLPTVLLLGGGLLGLAAGLRLGLRPAERLANVLLAFAGAALGVWQALRGARWVTWEVPDSARRQALQP
jgi:hypothetical protein